jgi:hypothetical protein
LKGVDRAFLDRRIAKKTSAMETEIINKQVDSMIHMILNVSSEGGAAIAMA